MKTKRRKKTKRKRSKTLNPIKTLIPKKALNKNPVTKAIAKYYRQRYCLFSKYDDGVQLDEVGWFSVTPEPIAELHASRIPRHCLVVDCFSGVAGNSIQFAARSCHVIAIEVDPTRVEFAVNNAKIYGVENNIDFVIGDFFKLAPCLKGDVAFLSPPWGGPSYSNVPSFTLDMLKPKDGYSIFKAAQIITPNIMMFLPRNVDLNQVAELSWLSSPPLNLKTDIWFGSTLCAGSKLQAQSPVTVVQMTLLIGIHPRLPWFVSTRA